jgi:hypothetical protein
MKAWKFLQALYLVFLLPFLFYLLFLFRIILNYLPFLLIFLDFRFNYNCPYHIVQMILTGDVEFSNCSNLKELWLSTSCYWMLTISGYRGCPPKFVTHHLHWNFGVISAPLTQKTIVLIKSSFNPPYLSIILCLF